MRLNLDAGQGPAGRQRATAAEIAGVSRLAFVSVTGQERPQAKPQDGRHGQAGQQDPAILLQPEKHLTAIICSHLKARQVKISLIWVLLLH